MTRFSLRTRLVAVVVAVTIFALTAGGAATWLALRAYLYNRMDDQLHFMSGGWIRGVNERIATGIPRSGLTVDGGPGPADDKGGSQIWLAILEPDGTPATTKITATNEFFGTSESIYLSLSAEDIADLIAASETDDDALTVETTDGQSMLAMAQPVYDGYYLLTGLRTTSTDANLNQLLMLELAVGGAAVLAAVGLGAYGVRAGMRPLTRVSQTAHEIAENLKRHGSGLERRVPPSDPRTEVGQLTEAVNTMLGEAQAAYAQRVENEDRMRRFLADASHELRTPLTSLRGYAELERLRAGTLGAEDPAATQDALRRIETEGDRMARLVDDLLLLARTDQGSSAPELGPVPVDELLDEAADRAGAAHPNRPFVVDTPSTGLMLVGDREALLQVLGNLMRNAAIHTPGPRPIRLGARPDGNSVLLLVADEGPGMSPEQAAHAFERFWRADSGRTRATGGSGLGLAIVHALVAAQSGSVTLTSDVATGTTVLVRMPGLLDDTGRLVHRPTPEHYPQQYTDPATGAHRSVGTPDYRRLP
ncbi:HAMP domain-containing sensor histidine kinase [Cryptosporangium japonicum]|uniref:histidine kinase n=1 Tax=Cryptosporangium japonicum TaxID=80872 RepID=A0ABN0VB35_9ACTN